jgi:hypothetical protein
MSRRSLQPPSAAAMSAGRFARIVKGLLFVASTGFQTGDPEGLAARWRHTGDSHPVRHLSRSIFLQSPEYRPSS